MKLSSSTTLKPKRLIIVIYYDIADLIKNNSVLFEECYYLTDDGPLRYVNKLLCKALNIAGGAAHEKLMIAHYADS